MGRRRIVRTPLPVELIRGMDELILGGIGGFETRAEFIEDAIRERILELRYDEAGESDEIDATLPVSPQEGPGPRLGSPGNDGLSLEATALRVETEGLELLDEEIYPVRNEPLFGLHNRDYPSLWAVSILVGMCRGGPVPFTEFEIIACDKAWEFGEELLELERSTGLRLTGIFPTNKQKRKAAEGAFRSFALGGYREGNGGVTTHGPLFLWRAASLKARDGELLIGPTQAGCSLLSAMSGLTAEAPHERRFADIFLVHLRERAPADWWGFERVLTVVSEGSATRGDVVEDFASGPYEWTENEISTNSAGYVARAREWGLVEPKLKKGRYTLTDYGREVVSGLEGGR